MTPPDSTLPDTPPERLAVRVRGLTKRFGPKTVVQAIDMDIPKGAVFGFLGPNGSGKTTFIRMLTGLLEPSAGGGTCLGLDIHRERAAIKRRIGYMTQRFSLYEDLSVRENLDFVARMYALPQRRRRVDGALDRLGLGGRGHQLAGTLSGGWKQRLALAACLLHRPDLLILDEPTAGVDPKARREFWDEIHRLAAGGLTVLVTTHYMDEAERCSLLGYIAYGQLLAYGTRTQLVESSGLATVALHGPGLSELAAGLRGDPAVEQAVLFGQTLHVSGPDRAALAAAVETRLRPGQRVHPAATGLEDVFISLMSRAQDNFVKN